MVEYFVEEEKNIPKSRGRTTTLPLILHWDLTLCGKSFRSPVDLTYLWHLARNRNEWNANTDRIVEAMRQQYLAKMADKHERQRLKRVQSEIDIGVLEPSERAPKRPRRRIEDEKQDALKYGSSISYLTTHPGPLQWR
jgi:hypothetical protein